MKQNFNFFLKFIFVLFAAALSLFIVTILRKEYERAWEKYFLSNWRGGQAVGEAVVLSKGEDIIFEIKEITGEGKYKTRALSFLNETTNVYLHEKWLSEIKDLGIEKGWYITVKEYFVVSDGILALEFDIFKDLPKEFYDRIYIRQENFKDSSDFIDVDGSVKETEIISD